MTTEIQHAFNTNTQHNSHGKTPLTHITEDINLKTNMKTLNKLPQHQATKPPQQTTQTHLDCFFFFSFNSPSTTSQASISFFNTAFLLASSSLTSANSSSLWYNWYNCISSSLSACVSCIWSFIIPSMITYSYGCEGEKIFKKKMHKLWVSLWIFFNFW